MLSSVASEGSKLGHALSKTLPVPPVCSHNSSAMCGANGATSGINGNTSSHDGGALSPLRTNTFMYSIIAATAVL